MTSVPRKDILHSAIAIGDWLLACQKPRNKERFEEIFVKLYEVFKQSRVDEIAFSAFLDALEDVFDILYEGKIKGHVIIHVSSIEGGDDRVVEKTFRKLLGNAQDYLMFLFVFAKHLDSLNPGVQESETHLISVIRAVKNLKPREKDAHQAEDFAEFRLKTLMAGFNFLSSHSIHKYDALCMILEFAKENGIFYNLIPYIHQLGDWTFKNSQCVSAHRRQVYSSIIEGLREYQKNEKDLYIIVKKLVNEFDTDIAELSLEDKQKALAAAVELLVLAINITDIVFYDDIYQSETVQALREGEHSPLFQLGLIFYRGDCVDLQLFFKKYPGVLSKYGCQESRCLEKLQLIVLSSIPSANPALSPSNYYPLEEIATKLLVSTQQAERLAIKAIVLKLIDGRIDQMRGIIHIRSSLHRTFERAQWSHLKEKLQAYGNHLDMVQSKL